MFKGKFMLVSVLLCLVLVVGVGFAAWTITDTFTGSVNGTIDADQARAEDFVEISEPTEFLRYTTDGYMYYHKTDENGDTITYYYNKITVDVTVDVNKWKELFGDTVDAIYVELTLEASDDLPNNVNKYSIFDKVTSQTICGDETYRSGNNITGYRIDLTELKSTTVDGVTTYDEVVFTTTFIFDPYSLGSDTFSDPLSILRYNGNMFNINSTISIQKN